MKYGSRQAVADKLYTEGRGYVTKLKFDEMPDSKTAAALIRLHEALDKFAALLPDPDVGGW